MDIFYIIINIYTQARREASAISPWGEAQGLAKGFEVLDMAVPTTQHTFTHSGLSLLPRGELSGGLNEKGSHRLPYLNGWSPVGRFGKD